MKVFKFFEYAYLVVMCFFLYEAYEKWESGGGNGKSYLYIIIACIAVFMFFFKRNFRKKFEANNKD